MGIGGSIFLIALGAIITFGVHADLGWLDLDVVGWVLMSAGALLLGLTWWFWNRRRTRPPIAAERHVHPAAAEVPPSDADLVRGRDTTAEYR